MDNQKKPRAREKKVVGNGKGVEIHGEGLGTGPVGSQNGYAGKPQSGSGGGGKRAAAAGDLLLVRLVPRLLLGADAFLMGGMIGAAVRTVPRLRLFGDPHQKGVSPSERMSSKSPRSPSAMSCAAVCAAGRAGAAAFDGRPDGGAVCCDCLSPQNAAASTCTSMA